MLRTGSLAPRDRHSAHLLPRHVPSCSSPPPPGSPSVANRSVPSRIRSFIHSFIHSFVHSFVRSRHAAIPSFLRPLVHSCTCSFFLSVLSVPSVHPCVHTQHIGQSICHDELWLSGTTRCPMAVKLTTWDPRSSLHDGVDIDPLLVSQEWKLLCWQKPLISESNACVHSVSSLSRAGNGR